MPRWEYKIEMDHYHGERAFNFLGEEGWELVGFDRGAAIFKRPLSDDDYYRAKEAEAA